MKRIAVILLLPFIFVGIAIVISLYTWSFIIEIGFPYINTMLFAILLITLNCIISSTKFITFFNVYLSAVLLGIVLFALEIHFLGNNLKYGVGIFG